MEAALTPRPRGDGSSAACYLHATAADLSLGALKLSGSAQVWSGSTVLQHGSFTLTRDVAREARVFRLGTDDTARLAEQTATIAGSLGERPSSGRVEKAVVSGMARGLGVRVRRGELTAYEIDLAHSLIAETDADTLPSRGRVRTSR